MSNETGNPNLSTSQVTLCEPQSIYKSRDTGSPDLSTRTMRLTEYQYIYKSSETCRSHNLPVSQIRLTELQSIRKKNEIREASISKYRSHLTFCSLTNDTEPLCATVDNAKSSRKGN